LIIDVVFAAGVFWISVRNVSHKVRSLAESIC
jgi:hypothetical protein